MNVDLRALIGKLNPTTRGAVEAAAGLCLSRTHYDVEVEHYLLKLMDHPEDDFLAILKRFEIDRSALAKQLTAALDRLKSGNARTPSLSPGPRADADRRVDGRIAGSRSGVGPLRALDPGHGARRRPAAAGDRGRARTGEDPPRGAPPGVRLDRRGHVGRRGVGSRRRPGRRGSLRPAEGAGGPTPNLDQYTVNLTQRATDGHLDPVLGRDVEIRQVRRHPHAEAAEQPDPGRRGRGRQDRGGRGLRDADRRGRRAAAAPQRHDPDPRSGAAAGGRRSEGRVREPVEGADRGGQVVADARDPVHRRGAYDDRRGRARPGRTTRPTC